MSDAKEIIWTGLLYAAAIAVGIVAAKLVHGFLSGTQASAASPTS